MRKRAKTSLTGVKMIFDLQKASLLKRISAYIFDLILFSILSVGVALLLSVVLGYDDHSQTLDACYEKYAAEYGVRLDLTEEEYLSLSEEELARYDAASKAISADPEANYAYNMIVGLALMILSLSVLAAYLVLEFALPLIFGNGQTLGKKIFGIALIRSDGVRLTTLQLFVRTVLGKYTVETMIPILIVIMILFANAGIVGTAVLLLILVLQSALFFATANKTVIHDIMAGTVAVDYASQMIFDSAEALLEYKKRIHAEQSARETY